MFKKIFLQGLLAALLASIAALIYSHIYLFATEVDFSKVLNTWSIIGLNTAICMLAVFLNWILVRWMKHKGEIIFNFLFSIVSFAGLMIPISITLPLSVKFPELFPGMAVPMVLFPAIAWYTVHPIFTNKHYHQQRVDD